MADGRIGIRRRVGVIALAGVVALCAPSCKMSDKKVEKVRSKSYVFEVTGTSRVFDRVNAWGDPVGRDAARERSRRDARAQIDKRIVFGRFHVSPDRFELSRPNPPSYKTAIKEDARKGDLYRTTIEVFVSRKAFPDDKGWVRIRHLDRSETSVGESAQAMTETVNKALVGFVNKAARIHFGKVGAGVRLDGDIRAIVSRRQTFGSVCQIEIEGVVQFQGDRPRNRRYRGR